MTPTVQFHTSQRILQQFTNSTTPDNKHNSPTTAIETANTSQQHRYIQNLTQASDCALSFLLQDVHSV